MGGERPQADYEAPACAEPVEHTALRPKAGTGTRRADLLPTRAAETTLAKVLNRRFLGKSPLAAWLRLNERAFALLPSGALKLRAVQAYARCLHTLVRMCDSRTMYFGTFFMRNRPQLDLVLRLVGQRDPTAPALKVLVVACSIGAEVYSLVGTIRSRSPGINMTVTAIDVSADAMEFARRGRYPLYGCEFTGENIFERLTAEERTNLFESSGDCLSIRPWVREGITWLTGDAADPALAGQLGTHDMVFANNFLCHLHSADSEQCLRNIVRFVKPGGYLFVSGVDLDARAKVVKDLRLVPVTDLLEEIHAGDPSLIKDWPFRYWGLEAFDPQRADRDQSYASALRVPMRDPQVGDAAWA